jgi:hypothetical protein
MPLSLSQRNPDLIARVDDAYERALTAQGELAAGVGGVALDALIEGDVTAAREQGSLAGSGLEAVTSPDTRAAFGETLTHAEQLFGRIGLATPSAEQLAESGVDFAALGAAHEQMERDGLEPRLVLAPSIRPDEWQQIYGVLEAGNVSGGRIKNGGLWINDDIKAAWHDLSQVPETVPATVVPDNEGYRTAWTLRVIPGTNRPTETNITHNDPSYPDKPTVHEYLSLQASLLQNGEDPIDDSTYTWLNGTFADGSRAPFGFWDPGDGRVGLDRAGVGNRGDNLGVRLPVWGEAL